MYPPTPLDTSTLLGCDISDIIEHIPEGEFHRGTSCPRSRLPPRKGDILQIQKSDSPKRDKPSVRQIEPANRHKKAPARRKEEKEGVVSKISSQHKEDAGLSASTPAHVTRSALESKKPSGILHDFLHFFIIPESIPLYS